MKTLRRILVSVLMVSVCLAITIKFFWVHVDPSKPTTILAAIHQRGVSWVVAETLQDEQAWDLILDQIETGMPEWIEVYKALTKEPDGQVAIDLLSAMAHALEKNPELVLTTLSETGSAFKVEQICGTLDTYEADNLPAAIESLNARKDSVNAVTKPELYAAKEKCLGQITQALAKEIVRE